MLFDLLVAAVFLVMVVYPTYRDRGEVPHRIKALKKGWKGFLYVPVAALALFSGLVAGIKLKQWFPFLEWGWLGYNIAAAPIKGLAETGTGTGAGAATGLLGNDLVVLALVIPFAAVLVLALLIFNWYEEQDFRNSYKQVAVWAFAHLLMGIPLFAVIPIFSVGLVYKYVYDRYGEVGFVEGRSLKGDLVFEKRFLPGIEEAYAAHFGTNFLLVTLMVVAVTLT